MLVWKRIIWLRQRVKEQKEWINRCGGDLSGYIANYGDPGVPPLDKEGNPKTFTVPADKQYLFDDHVRVPGTEDRFYASHSGDGGTAIYQADWNRLQSWEQQLADTEIRHHAARLKADEKQEAGVKVAE